MTIEEAIVYWETFLSEIDQMEVDDCWTNEDAETQREATKMAISALRAQQETVTDSHQMTNADRIRSMTDEELALWICGVYDIEEEHGKFINGIIIPGYAPHDIEEWLQMPAEEDDHDKR